MNAYTANNAWGESIGLALNRSNPITANITDTVIINTDVIIVA